MKREKIALFFILILIPSVSFAAWWNPFSWGNRETVEVENINEEEILQESVQEEEKALLKVSEKEVEIKTVFTTDPSMSKMIEELIAENKKLRLEIAELRKQNNVLSSKDSEVKTKDNSVSSEFAKKCTYSKEQILYLNDEIESLDDKYEKIRIQAIEDKPESGYLKTEKYAISLLGQKNDERSLLENALSNTKEDLDLYCR